MQYVDLIAVLALLQFFSFGALTGRARNLSGLEAPAMTGDEGFERMYRVQMNTLEILVLFLPALFLAAKYWPAVAVAGLGAIYLVGRHLYWRAYVSDPSKRGLGFMLSMLPTLILLVMTFAGIVLSMVGGSS